MYPIEKLTDGFKTFRSGYYQERQETYANLFEHGQKPSVAMIACADSRVDPGIVLQADPGELFLIRNVANLVPPYDPRRRYQGTSAALEFATHHLQVEHIIVLGHAQCGGIKALFNKQTEDEPGNHFIFPWMSLVRPAYERVQWSMPDASEGEKMSACERRAVLISLDNLMTFPEIREGVEAGRMRLHGWHIDLKAGSLERFDPASDRFVPV
ncbi:MAG: carbonic anhydrase [Magnetospiraceae bacterium]